MQSKKFAVGTRVPLPPPPSQTSLPAPASNDTQRG